MYSKKDRKHGIKNLILAKHGVARINILRVACAQLIISNGKNMKPKKKYSPHLSIKRLRELARKYAGVKENFMYLMDFISHVETSRPSLNKKTK